MHIAYLHYLCPDASGLHHVRQFAAAARDLGNTVDVCALNLATGSKVRSGLPSVSAATRRFLKNKLSRYLHEPKELIWNIRYFSKETRILEQARPDVLLVRDQLLTASCVFVARRLGLPLVLELNAPAAESRAYFDQYLHLPLIPESLERLKIRQAKAVVVVSAALKQYLVDRYGAEEEKIVVNPNGADTSAFRPGLPADRRLYAHLQAKTVVGFVGSFQKFHGSELLARMACRVAKLRPSVSFLFVGDGPGTETVRRMMEGLSDRVFFTGRVEHQDVPSLVAGLDIAVMPESNFYGSPLKVIEWMAAGKAIVAPAYGPLKEIIDSGREGLLFPPQDEDALVQQVLTLVDSPELREKLGRCAADRVRRSLTWEHNARRVLAACANALEDHRIPTTRNA